MTTFLYLLIAALIFGVIGYVLASMNCAGGERYLASTPVDPVTEDDGSCEDEETKAAQEAAEVAKAAEAQALLDEQAAEEAAAKAKADEEAALAAAAAEKAEAEAKAKEAAALAAAKEKEAQEKAAKAEAQAKAQEEAEAKATAEKEAAEKEAVEAKAQKEAVIAQTEAAQSSDDQEPEGIAPEGLLSAPRGGKKDNLTRIKGIGVKIDQALNGIGIYHFDQIAAWTEDNMAWADKALAFPGRAKRDDWVGQAKLLAEGKETEFSQRVDKGEVASSKKA